MLFLHRSREVRILADAVWTLGVQGNSGAERGRHEHGAGADRQSYKIHLLRWGLGEELRNFWRNSCLRLHPMN
jgi:hypothetical protein